MVEHIVIMKPKKETTAAEKEALIKSLLAMKGRIPGVIDISAGETFTDRHQGYVIGLVVRLADRAALDAYGPHPVHQPVKERVLALCEDVIAVDYEW